MFVYSYSSWSFWLNFYAFSIAAEVFVAARQIISDDDDDILVCRRYAAYISLSH